MLATTHRQITLGDLSVRIAREIAREFPYQKFSLDLEVLVSHVAAGVVAAGRCVDGDSHALSAIRVMGPCIAMGAAAAHALDLAGTGSVHNIDLAQFQHRLRDNLEATRP